MSFMDAPRPLPTFEQSLIGHHQESHWKRKRSFITRPFYLLKNHLTNLQRSMLSVCMILFESQTLLTTMIWWSLKNPGKIVTFATTSKIESKYTFAVADPLYMWVIEKMGCFWTKNLFDRIAFWSREFWAILEFCLCPFSSFFFNQFWKSLPFGVFAFSF